MTVKVPSLVGLTVPEAREVGRVAGVVVTLSDVSGVAQACLVTAQLPLPGTRVHLGTAVVVEFDRVSALE